MTKRTSTTARDFWVELCKVGSDWAVSIIYLNEQGIRRQGISFIFDSITSAENMYHTLKDSLLNGSFRDYKFI